MTEFDIETYIKNGGRSEAEAKAFDVLVKKHLKAQKRVENLLRDGRTSSMAW